MHWEHAVGFDHGLPCRVKKTWPVGLSRQKPRPKAEVFVVTEARGLCFSHGMGERDQILLKYGRRLIFPVFYSHKYEF